MNFDSEYTSQFKNVIEEIVRAELDKRQKASFISAVVNSVNEDGTVNVYIPPNKNSIITNMANKTGELLQEGDSVEIMMKNGNLSNSWIDVKHGLSSNYVKQCECTPGDNSGSYSGGSGGGIEYQNKNAVEGGTDVSLVTTGEKYNWNNNYVPKSGGTMTGDLVLDDAKIQTKELDITTGASGELAPTFKVTQHGGSNSYNNLDIGYDYSKSEGAGIGFRSKNASDSGSFSMYARNSGGTTTLNGYPDGRLLWGSKRVITKPSSSNDAVGDSTTPVYIDSNGYAQPCTSSIPTVPDIVDDLVTNDSTKTLSAKQGKILNDTKADKTELFSKSYNDLTDKPTIPTKTSDLTNDSGFITNADVPDIADNLTTNDATKTLSAKQGKRLKDSVELLTNSINGMQETLVSGTNIKTINNQSLLGSGNINISSGGTAEIPDEITHKVGYCIDASDCSEVRSISLVGEMQNAYEYNDSYRTPSFDNPPDIACVRGNIGITVAKGKNLLDASHVTTNDGDSGIIPIFHPEDGSITFRQAANHTSIRLKFNVPVPLIPEENYVLSVCWANGNEYPSLKQLNRNYNYSEGLTVEGVILENDLSGDEFRYDPGYGDLSGAFAFTAPNISYTGLNDYGYRLELEIDGFDIDAGTSGRLFVQLEKGSTATEFEPYKGVHYPISLGDIELYKSGKYRDRIFKQNGVWYLEKQMSKADDLTASYDYDEDEHGWNLYTTRPGDANVFIFGDEETLEGVYSNTFPVTYDSSTNIGYLKAISDNGGFTFAINPAEYNGEEAIDLIEATTVIYALDSPVITKITDQALLDQLNAIEVPKEASLIYGDYTSASPSIRAVIDAECYTGLKNTSCDMPKGVLLDESPISEASSYLNAVETADLIKDSKVEIYSVPGVTSKIQIKN